jgi:hypothetical protein
MIAVMNRGVSLALARLRRGVVVCCWVIGMAVFAQLIIWSLATYTDVRHEVIEQVAEAPLIVSADAARSRPAARLSRDHGAMDSAAPPAGSQAAAPAPASAPVAAPVYGASSAGLESERVPSPHDSTMQSVFDLGSTFARCAMLALLAFIGIAVVLASGASVPGVERTTSAFIWAAIVGLIALPLGGAFALPWTDGALCSYEHMTSSVETFRDATLAAEPSAEGLKATPGWLELHVRFALVPVIMIVGLAFIGLRFCASVEMALLPRESPRLDPALEREASNIAPSSLHGGRLGTALTRTLETPTPIVESHDGIPGAGQLSPGKAPKRLI